MANVIQFTIKGIDKASGTITKVAKSTAKLAAATIAAAGAGLAFTKSMANAQDEIGKFSIRLGISTEALSGFHQAAALGGVSVQTFDMGLQRMTRRVAEASQGLGEAKDALFELNLNAKQLAKLPVEEQMNQVADALNGVESQADKVRLAFKLFDSEGVALLQTMQGGSKAFRDAAKDAAFLGTIVSQQAAANSAKFNDSMTRLGASVKGAGMALANQFMPHLTTMINAVANFIASHRDSMVTWFRNAVKGAVTFGFIAVEVFNNIKKGIASLFTKEGLDKGVKAWQDYMKRIFEISLAILPAMGKAFINSFRAIGDGLIASIKWAWGKVFDLIKGTDVTGTFSELIFGDIPAATAAARTELNSAFSTIGTEIGGGLKDLKTNVLDFLIPDPTAIQDRAAATLAKMAEFGTAVLEQKTAEDELDKARITDKLSWEAEVTKEGRDALRKFSDMSVRGQTKFALDQASQLTAGVANENKTLFKINKGVALATAVINTAEGVTKALSAYPPPISFAMAGLQAAAGAVQIGAIAGSKFGGAKALGGAVTGGTSFLVGEQGPELFTPGASGRISANDSLGGTTVIEVVNISVLPNATNAESLLQMPQELMTQLVAGPILAALNSLDDAGIRQKSLERLPA